MQHVVFGVFLTYYFCLFRTVHCELDVCFIFTTNRKLTICIVKLYNNFLTRDELLNNLKLGKYAIYPLTTL